MWIPRLISSTIFNQESNVDGCFQKNHTLTRGLFTKIRLFYLLKIVNIGQTYTEFFIFLGKLIRHRNRCCTKNNHIDRENNTLTFLRLFCTQHFLSEIFSSQEKHVILLLNRYKKLATNARAHTHTLRQNMQWACACASSCKREQQLQKTVLVFDVFKKLPASLKLQGIFLMKIKSFFFKGK